MIRWIGFCFIVSGGAYFGFLLSADVKRCRKLYEEMLHVLGYMKTEIEFRLTPLHVICKALAQQCSQPLSQIFEELYGGEQLLTERNMEVLLEKYENILPGALKRQLKVLFLELGKQDVCAQLSAIELCRQGITVELEKLQTDGKERSRSYRIIGVCAGLAVAVILI